MKFLLFTKYHKNHTSLCSRQKRQPNIVLCRSKKDDPKRNAVLRWKHRTNRFVFPRNIAAHLVSAFATANVVASAPCPRCIVLKRAVFHFFFFPFFLFFYRDSSIRLGLLAVFKNSRNIWMAISRKVYDRRIKRELWMGKARPCERALSRVSRATLRESVENT